MKQANVIKDLAFDMVEEQMRPELVNEAVRSH